MNHAPNDLSAYFMPFTANRQYKSAPRMMASAKGMHYTTVDGRDVLDGVAGLWCTNAGHSREKITSAIADQLAELDYSPAFQMGHPKAFALANKLSDMAPGQLNHVFYTNSGSESVETALKMARAYHISNGQAERTMFIGRARGYHGVNFGGMSVGGIPLNQNQFKPLLSDVAHLPDTHDLEKNAFTRGQPEHGCEKADALEELIDTHGAEKIAAVIVEPVAGSTGVLIPPKGYLERLRELTEKHGILLIFDEVITGFGRLGANFASDYFNITPDMMTMAKGLTNGVIPMGAVLLQEHIHDTVMQGPDHMIEVFHGYTYSGNPAACAAALATLDVYDEENLFSKAAKLAKPFEDMLHSLKDCPHVIDIRNLGLVGAVELSPIKDAPTKRAFSAYLHAFENGLLVRTTGDIIALSPPLIANENHIAIIGEILRNALISLNS